MSEELHELWFWGLIYCVSAGGLLGAAFLAAGWVELRADGRTARLAKKQARRMPTWRDVEPSRWRGFLFTLRKRPGLAARWVTHRYLCRPVVRVFRALRSVVRRAAEWLSKCVSPALRRAQVQRAWGRVELAQQFNRKGGSL